MGVDKQLQHRETGVLFANVLHRETCVLFANVLRGGIRACN